MSSYTGGNIAVTALVEAMLAEIEKRDPNLLDAILSRALELIDTTGRSNSEARQIVDQMTAHLTADRE